MPVRPFADLSNDRSQEDFGDGPAGELLTTLRSSAVAVAPRTSSFECKGRGLSVREIAGELGVGHSVDGSVRKSGERLRTSVQVIDVRSDRQLWAETFDREAGVIFRIQAEIADAVAAALRVRLAGRGGTPAGTRDAEAYDLYPLGLHHWHQRTPEGLERAVEFFTEATARDPGFARAWAGLRPGPLAPGRSAADGPLRPELPPGSQHPVAFTPSWASWRRASSW